MVNKILYIGKDITVHVIVLGETFYIRLICVGYSWISKYLYYNTNIMYGGFEALNTRGLLVF